MPLPSLPLPRLASEPGTRSGYLVIAAVISLSTLSTAVPTPLYAEYAAEWEISPTVLTVIFGVYALSLLLTLIAAGAASDAIGRRPVVLAGLLALVVSTVLFLTAGGVGSLLAARIAQGIGVALILSAGSAALVELHPRRDGDAAGLLNAVLGTILLGVGVLAAALLVSYGPLPRQLPFLLVLAGLLPLALLVTALPETSPRSVALPRPQLPRVPRTLAGPFLIAAIAALASWSIGGLYMSLGPQIASDLIGPGPLPGGVAMLLMSVFGTLSQLSLRRLEPATATALGSSLLAVGVAAAVLATRAGSPAAFLIATAVTGFGWGLPFLAGLRSLTELAPARHRSEVLAAYFVVIFVSFSVPAVLAGLATSAWGLTRAFTVFGAVVVALGVAVAVAARRLHSSSS